ncbi:MAG: hypothetical protein PHE89_02520 [Alphaproteobacteria bacterium]|nr:hypothetical protein [Alphaproteobacteria bacterium]
MHNRIKNLLLRLLPYLISILSGAFIYHLSMLYLDNSDLSVLLMNIASTLLSIPIMFIFYELINEICTKNLNNSISKGLIFEINYIISDLVKIFQQLLGRDAPLDEEELYLLLSSNREEVAQNLSLSKDAIALLDAERKKLFEFTHGNFNLSVLSDPQIKSLMAIIRNVTIIYKEVDRKKMPNKELVAENLYQTLQSISKWVYLCDDEDSILNHHSME